MKASLEKGIIHSFAHFNNYLIIFIFTFLLVVVLMLLSLLLLLFTQNY